MLMNESEEQLPASDTNEYERPATHDGEDEAPEENQAQVQENVQEEDEEADEQLGVGEGEAQPSEISPRVATLLVSQEVEAEDQPEDAIELVLQPDFEKEDQLLVDIERPESPRPESATETQTQELMGPLSFEDPRFFQLDEIIGPDDTQPHVEQYMKRKMPRTGMGKKSSSFTESELIAMRKLSAELRSCSYGLCGDGALGASDFGDNQDMEESGCRAYDSALCNPDPAQAALDFEAFAKGLLRQSDECVGQHHRKLERVASLSECVPSPPRTPDTEPRMFRCPSIESILRIGENPAIRFHVLKDQKLYSKDVRLDRTIGEVKKELACIVKVPPEHIELRRHKNLVMDYKTLEEIGAKPGKLLRLTIEVSKRAENRFQLNIPQEQIEEKRDSIIRQLRIKAEKGWKTIQLTVEFPTSRKLYLGGYRDKLTKLEFHHAQTQTPIVKRSYRQNQVDKAAQAFRETDTSVQTLTTTYTQVDRRDYFTCTRNQTYIISRPYVNTELLHKRRNRAAIIIQRYWRRWLAKKEKDDRLKALLTRVQWAENLRKGRTEARLALKQEEKYRQHNPKTALDIELLYRAINSWKKEQIDYVLKNRWGAEKKAALADLMEKEADVLLDLERAKAKILQHKENRRVQTAFRKMGAPTRWLTNSGSFVTIDTPGKTKARELQDLYAKLQAPVSSPSERLTLLQQVYSLVKDLRNTGSEFLIQLIGREVALIQRKSKQRLLPHLRKRVATAFFNLSTDYRFNPAAKVLSKVPFEMRTLKKDMIQCRGCKRMLNRDQFTITRGVNVTSRCTFCTSLYTKCILRLDLNLYRRMLLELRRDEQAQGVENSIAYLIDEYDLQFLVEQLWHGQSALSSISDRYILRLCRWDKTKPWSPWNCVLLTEEEAVSHLHIQHMEQAYQPSFLHKVRLRHSAARSYFQRTDKISKQLLPNSHQTCVTSTCL